VTKVDRATEATGMKHDARERVDGPEVGSFQCADVARHDGPCGDLGVRRWLGQGRDSFLVTIDPAAEAPAKEFAGANDIDGVGRRNSSVA
jgi:hypothetical protein